MIVICSTLRYSLPNNLFIFFEDLEMKFELLASSQIAKPKISGLKRRKENYEEDKERYRPEIDKIGQVRYNTG